MSRLLPGIEARQFEYHPVKENLALVGTLDGGIGVVNVEKNKLISGRFYDDIKNSQDTILGLAWSKKNPNYFITGSQKGKLTVHTVKPGEILKSDDFCAFDELTSIHLNSTEDKLLVSGYQKNVSIFDFETGKVTQKFVGIHEKHINISRFTNHSPNIFATCSFDKYVKMWDTRIKPHKPIYGRLSNNGNVMICFSPNDTYILASAVDNEVRQYLTVDGRLQMLMDIDPYGRSDNYTRSYYMNDGDVVVSGSSEQDVIHLNCAHTGAALYSGKLFDDRADSSLYIQSLRGSPHRQNEFVLLVNYRADPYSLELLKIDINEHGNAKCSIKGKSKGDAEANVIYKNVLSFTSDGLNSDLFNFFEVEENASFYDTITLLCHPSGETNTGMKDSTPALSSNDINLSSDIQIKACGWLLCARSPFFLKILKHPKTNNSEEYAQYDTGTRNGEITVRLPDHLTPRAVQCAIEFMKKNDIEHVRSLLNAIQSNNENREADIRIFLKECFIVATVFEMKAFFTFIENEAAEHVSIASVHEFLKLSKAVKAEQLLKFVLFFLVKNIKIIDRFQYLKYCKSVDGTFFSKSKTSPPQSQDTTSMDDTGRLQPSSRNSAYIDLKDEIRSYGCQFEISKSDINYIESILHHQSQFRNCASTHLGGKKLESTMVQNNDSDKMGISYRNLCLKSIRRLGCVDQEDVFQESSNYTKAENTLTPSLGMTMIDYFQNKNISAKNYITNCLGVDPSSSKYQRLFSKLSAHYNCIADLMQADMVESGDGTILIMNGHSNTSYYNYAKILSYDAQRHVFSFTPAYGTIPVSQDSGSGHSCCIDHLRNTHVCLLHSRNFETIKILNTATMEWTTENICGGEADISFNQESYSHNRARSCFTINSLSENKTFCHDGLAKCAVYNAGGNAVYEIADNRLPIEMMTDKKSAFHFEDQYLIVFGGIVSNTLSGRRVLNDVCVLVAHPSNGSKDDIDVQYEFAWIQARIDGLEFKPPPRVYHTSTILRHSGQTVMIVYGGVGERIFNDFSCLDLSNLREEKSIKWIKTTIRGMVPEGQHHHNAVAISDNQFCILGGNRSSMQNDLYMITLQSINCNLSDIGVEMSCERVCTCGSTLHANLSFNSAVFSRAANRILLFGGQTMPRVGDNTGNTYNGMHEISIPSITDQNDRPYEINPVSSTIEDFGEFPCVVFPPLDFGGDMIRLLRFSYFSDVEFEVIADKHAGEGNPVNFKAEYVRIKAHKSILIARSERFKALLLGGMSESTQGIKPILLHGIRESVFQALLIYLYSDTLLPEIRNDYQLIMELYVTANEYTLSRLIRLCEGILLNLLQIENAAEFLEFAQEYGMADTLSNQRDTSHTKIVNRFRRQCRVCLEYEDEQQAVDGRHCRKCRHDSFRLINMDLVKESTIKAYQVKCSILKESCISYILRHFADVQKTDGYHSLPTFLKDEVVSCFKSSVYSTDAVSLEKKGLLHVLPSVTEENMNKKQKLEETS